MCLLHPLRMKQANTWKPLGTLTNRIAARLSAVREGKIFAGDAERPADEWGAAAGTYTPTAAGERVNLGGEEGTVARQHGMKTAASPPRTAETAKGPMPPRAVSAVPLGW